MNSISILVYTHSDYSFLWKASIPLLEKYASKFQIHWCCDKLLDFTLPASWKLHTYDPNLVWSGRLRECVKSIPDEYILYSQEDMLLIDNVEESKVTYLLNFMKDKRCEFLMGGIRQMIASEEIPTPYEDYVLQRIHGHWMQPSIWKKTLLERIVAHDMTIRENELGVAYELTKQAICYAIVNKRFHEQSTRTLYFPHMHSINGGKWTFLKYPVLKSLVEMCGIDTSTRGVDTKWLIDYKNTCYNMN